MSVRAKYFKSRIAKTALLLGVGLSALSQAEAGLFSAHDAAVVNTFESHHAITNEAPPASEKRKKFGGSASCLIECSGPNGRVCRQIGASCGFNFDSEFAARNYLSAQLQATARAENGRITSGLSFSIQWRFESLRSSHAVRLAD
jgi:hypothetical protein